MNKLQFAYQTGRVVNNYCDVGLLASTGILGFNSVTSFVNSEQVLGAVEGAVGLYLGSWALLTSIARIGLISEARKINAWRRFYPLEHVENIVLDDAQGLSALLSRTANKEKKEWGTLLRVHDDKSRAVVSEITDSHVAEDRGLVKRRKRFSFCINLSMARAEDYGGTHHFHPHYGPEWIGGQNFAINVGDRYSEENWIHLITFNMPNGPEIIGHNRQHTYIPKDKSKRVLVKATPKQIMDYLAN